MFNRLQKIYSLIFLVLLLTGCSSEKEWNTTDISGLMPDLNMDLTNDEGMAVTQDVYMGKVNIVFFGYTYCPDICPTTLARIRLAIQQLSPSQRAQLNVLFISVDPARDTNEHLKAYIGSFGPEFQGLTGSQQQLKAMVRKYRVTYGYGELDDMGNYDVSHSSAVFVFDQSGSARLLARDSVTPEQLAADLARLII